MNNKNYSVYILTVPNKKRYIGFTSIDPEEAWANEGDLYESNKQGLYDDIQKYGWENIERQIAYVVSTRDDAINKKKELCLEYKSYLPENGYNRPIDAGIKKEYKERINTKEKFKSPIDDLYTVFVHLTPDGKIYVGMTNGDYTLAWKDIHYYYSDSLFYESIRVYKWDQIKSIVICERLDENTAIKLKEYLIKRYKADNTEYGYNVFVEETDRNYMVYVHIFPDGKKYVGLTQTSITTRWNKGKGYKNNERMYNAILEVGWDNIEHIVICEGLSKLQAIQLERNLIKIFNSNNLEYGYNNSSGGEVFFKRNHQKILEEKLRSEQIRRKFSYALINCYFDNFNNSVYILCVKFAKKYRDDILQKMLLVINSDQNYSNVIKRKKFDNLYGKMSYIYTMLKNSIQ